MSGPTLLLYNLSGPKGSAWRAAAMGLRIRLRPVTPAEYGLPLSTLLAGETEQAAVPLMGFAEPMLVMAGFPPRLMDAFLQAAKRMGAEKVALKAVLTPTNAAWDSLTLYRELCQERDAVKTGVRARHEAAENAEETKNAAK